MNKFKKVVFYEFEIEGEKWYASKELFNGRIIINIEEVRKNGQEDEHMVGGLYPNEEGVFGWESEGPVKWKPTDDAIAEFINNHHEEIDVIVINK